MPVITFMQQQCNQTSYLCFNY